MHPRRIRLVAAITGTVGLVAAAGLYAVTGAQAAAAGCAVSYSVTSQWAGGFGASVSVTNLGDPVASWQLSWSFTAGQTVSQLWNGTVAQSGAQVTVANASWNGSLATNASASFGFNGTWNNAANPVPASFTLNGVTCTGSASPGPSTTSSSPAPASPSPTPGAGTFQGLPNLAPNGCKNSGLPRSYGTNFVTPNDPLGQGFFDTTAIGWDGNFWPVFSYLSGSFFARGVNSTYTTGGTTICGGMYSFSAYTFGGNPPAQSVQWVEDGGYLPAMKTTRTSGSVTISLKDFADKVTVGGQPFLLV
ncbi:MAG TPA: cellulose-binding domain-containing protein, partial [Rugosimonospora sp.]|nr:cellulose-binding domain-containing protein [Rugosimonospora sp.]